MGSTRFSEIECGVPGIPRSLLSQRLQALARAGIVALRGEGRSRSYGLTQACQELFEVIERLGEWGQRWVNTEFKPEEVVDASLLMWDMRRRINWKDVPERRITVGFSIDGAKHESYWLVLDRGEASVCLHDPGFPVDLEVSADTLSLHRLWMGHLDYASALRAGLMRVEGPRHLARGFPRWLQLSYFSHVPPAPQAVSPVT